MLRVLISGGPGAGCTSTARALGERLRLPVFDSDDFFHKKTDPPFQEQYTPEERRRMVMAALGGEAAWILSGSVATWSVEGLGPTHGVFLDTPQEVRLGRLMERQRMRFGARIDAGGDMHEEHEAFMEWAAGYEERTGVGRNRETDRGYLAEGFSRFLELQGDEALEVVVARVLGFVTGAD